MLITNDPVMKNLITHLIRESLHINVTQMISGRTVNGSVSVTYYCSILYCMTLKMMAVVWFDLGSPSGIL